MRSVSRSAKRRYQQFNHAQIGLLPLFLAETIDAMLTIIEGFQGGYRPYASTVIGCDERARSDSRPHEKNNQDRLAHASLNFVMVSGGPPPTGGSPTSGLNRTFEFSELTRSTPPYTYISEAHYLVIYFLLLFNGSESDLAGRSHVIRRLYR
jgi:hypothetical protein